MVIPKSDLKHSQYYTDGNTVARWDSKRRLFWYWDRGGQVSYITDLRHIDDVFGSFKPTKEVDQDTVLYPIIFE